MKRTFLAVAVLCTALALTGAQPPKGAAGWEFLSRTDIGAKAFTDAHPEWDGRGVLIAVCDSGVDLGTPGLLTTTTGQPKIVDARVFSDEGKIGLEKAETSTDEHGTAWHAKDGKWLYGVDKLSVKPAEGSEVLVGYFKEEDFKNSDAKEGDLNANGRADDVYGLAVFKAADGKWTAFLDTNADGSLADEQPLGDFSETHQAFQLRGRDLHDAPALMTFALNLWPDEKKAALYMADGSHGTHVSGICAGHDIGGEPGLDGIAPGAQILALKIGSNVLSGGSTTPGSMVAAWRYAVKKAAEMNMPLVIQMSYGVGSEIEGAGVAEKLLDELLDENPGVVACVSNGNEGPGLSTAGLPACARDVIAVGAVLNRSSAKSLYGVSLSQDEMFSFSSRGGEMGKPQVVAPGFASSTVPVYEEGRDVFRGTSMASPQAAGACALLLSAAKAQGLPIRRDLCTAALERGATPLAGYTVLDQGHGLVTVPRSWEIYQALAKRPANRPLRFASETESPEMPSRKGPAVFWRGAFYPESRPQEIAVRPVFPRDASADFKASYYQAFDVACKADWLEVGRDAAYCKADQPARIPVRFNASRLAKPGLYATVVEGFSRDGGGSLGPEWTVPVSVVVPETFDARGGFRVEKAVKGLPPAKVDRTFFRVDPSLGTVTVQAKADEGEKGIVLVSLFDPEGRQSNVGVLRPGFDRFTTSLGNDDLEPGVWELDLYALYSNTGGASSKISLQAFPAARLSGDKLTVRMAQGQSPSASLELVSGLGATLRGEGKGQVVGSLTDREVKVHGATWSKSFSMAPGESGVVFDLSMPAQDFNKFTDTAVQVLDSEGKALVSQGFSYRMVTARFEPPKGVKPEAKYTLKISAATADPGDEAPSWTLHVKELHRYAAPVGMTVKTGKENGVVLYPDIPATLSLQCQAVPPALPEGACWLAEVTLKDADRAELQLPLELKLTPEGK